MAKRDRLPAENRKSRTSLEALQESRRRLLLTQESQRKEVASRLHGRVQNHLVVAAQWLHMACSALPQDSGQAKTYLEKAEGILRNVSEGELRHLSHVLYPALLSMGLGPALESLAGHYCQTLNVEFHLGSGVAQLERAGSSSIPDEIRIAAYRVMALALGRAEERGYRGAVTATLDVDSHGYLALRLDGNQGAFLEEDLPFLADFAEAVGGGVEPVRNGNFPAGFRAWFRL